MASAKDPAAETQAYANLPKRVLMGALLFLISAVALVVAAKWAGGKLVDGGHSLSQETRSIIVSGTMVQVPDNMIRRSEARRDGVRDKLDLYMVWPELVGYTHDNRAAFNHMDDTHRLVMFSLEPRMISRDMSSRYDLVYRKLLSSQAVEGPAELLVYEFEAGSGFEDELLYVGLKGGKDPFVARCLKVSVASDTFAPCERDVHLNEQLSLFYRFPRALLGEWRALDKGVVQKAQSLIGNQ
ncbi:hypothetical protein [Nitratireductor basaltis]|uniref:Transmembrane anchored protein n=1 Tax=Nitratireductor basaltis TaxID=472175 RepID=A0A084UAR5_9HYPH|nr:hypothetical protein [Nitratireductor basaltis]KFB10051.1 hypothetical protein EL18_01079 [Nitratireductor basaltis]